MIGINAQTGQPLADLDHLRQSIRDILTTRIGTRVMRRDYGSRLPDLVDRPMTPRLAMDVYSAVAEAIHRWEPRLHLTRVRIASVQAGQVVLELEGLYRRKDRPAQLARLPDINLFASTPGVQP